MFTSSTDVRHDSSEIVCAFHCSKAPRNFLLHFKHTNIPFSLIIVKWHREISKKQKKFFFMCGEAAHKRSNRPTLWPAFLGFPTGRYIGQPIGTGCMCPYRLRAHPGAGFIAVGYRFIYCSLFDCFTAVDTLCAQPLTIADIVPQLIGTPNTPLKTS